jgi:hypothetical protein
MSNVNSGMYSKTKKVKVKHLRVRAEEEDPDLTIKRNYINFLENIYDDVIKARTRKENI